MASDEYTIGWICALPIEKAAARGMLDEIHNTSFIRASSDKNSYTLGRIGPHNIVVASLPSGVYGETPAATVAAHMLASFQSVRIGLLVGIGGGIPSRSHDIRLGDVVVSRPEGTLGGVVQFDRGKTTTEGQFVRTGVLNKPPLVLLNALAELEAEREMEGSKVPLYIAEMVDRYPRMRTDYSCQGPSNDVLYRSDYNHSEEDDSTCDSCDPSEIVQRVERESEHPVIHYGIIASSNQVVKDAVLRDRIGKEFGAMCLEMEAAGIMDSFPCIVIRGVSDYADSHKNKRWQRYAAATAAAYAKELLHKVPPSELSAGPTALHLPRSELSKIAHDVQFVKQKIYLDALPVADGAAFDSYDNERSPRCHPETRKELLRQINHWSGDTDGKSVFWLNGMAGTGKSTIARTVARSFHNEDRLAASFFFKRGEASRGDASRFVTTIASQIASSIPGLAEHIQAAVQSTPLIADKGLGIQFSELIVQPVLALKLTSATPNIIVIDALDECHDATQIKAIIHLLSGPSMEKANLRVFLTSRPDTAIRIGFSQLARGVYDRLILHDVGEETINHDIRVVLVEEMRRTVQDYNAVASADVVLVPDWPGPKRIDQLAEIATPLFISAATICRFLADSRFSPGRQLAMLLEYKGASHASKLDLTYLPVLDQILSGDLTKPERDYLISEFHNIVGSLVILAEPLSAANLAKLLCLPKTRVEATLGHLHAVLSIPKDESPVRLFHASFRDFLLDDGLPEKSPFAVQGPAAHSHLLQRCLDRMSRTMAPMGVSYNVYGPVAFTGFDSIAEQQILNEVSPGDFRYACLYWVHHLEQAKGSIKPGDGIHCFLKAHFLDWVEALGVLNRPSEVLHSVQTLVSLADDSDKQSPLLQLLLDARRFVYGHKPVIERAPQLIHSSVILLPRSSLMRETFIHKGPTWITHLPAVPQSWSQPSLHVDGFALNCLAFAHDSSRLLSEFRVWDANSGHVLHTVSRYRPRSAVDRMHDYQYGVKALAFKTHHELTILTRGGQLQNWNLLTGEKTGLRLDSAINDAVFSADATKLAFIASSNPFEMPFKQSKVPSMAVRNNTTGRIILKLEGVEHALLSFSSDGSILACCTFPDDESLREAHIEVFELTHQRSHKLKVISAPLAHITMIRLSQNGRKLALYGEEQNTALVLVIDIGTYETEHMFPVSARVTCMSFSPNATTLTVVLEKKEFQLYDLITGRAQMIRKHCRHDVIAFAPDGLRIATAPRTANGMEIWNSLSNPYNTLEEALSSLDHCSPLFSLSPDGSIAATSQSKGNMVMIVDVTTKQIKHELQTLGVPEAVAFSRDGRIIAAKTVSYINTKEDESDNDSEFTFVDLDNDVVVVGKDIPKARDPCWLEVWNIKSKRSFPFRKGFPMSYRKSLFAVHPKGTRVAFALVDDTDSDNKATVEEWDIVYGDLLCTHALEAHIRVSKIQYSADGTRLDFVQYKESTSPPSMTITRIRTWQPGQDTKITHSRWRIEKHDLPRIGIWVTEDEAWIRYDSHYVLYIPGHMRPMQHVYLGTSFDSVCDENGEAVVGWVTIEGLFTTFRIDLAKLRLAGIGVHRGGERVRGS
ncbi:hypothetical protein BJX62DRAFT_242934 [Aspergillus germanicus]